MTTHNVAPTHEHGLECWQRHFSTTRIPRIPRISAVVVVHAIPTRCQSSSKHITEFQTRALQAAHSGGKTQLTAALPYVHVSIWWKRIGCTKLLEVMNSAINFIKGRGISSPGSWPLCLGILYVSKHPVSMMNVSSVYGEEWVLELSWRGNDKVHPRTSHKDLERE